VMENQSLETRGVGRNSEPGGPYVVRNKTETTYCDMI
jgi:hypothetical protein